MCRARPTRAPVTAAGGTPSPQQQPQPADHRQQHGYQGEDHLLRLPPALPPQGARRAAEALGGGLQLLRPLHDGLGPAAAPSAPPLWPLPGSGRLIAYPLASQGPPKNSPNPACRKHARAIFFTKSIADSFLLKINGHKILLTRYFTVFRKTHGLKNRIVGDKPCIWYGPF